MSTLDVYTFGETMLRLSTPKGERLETARSLDFRIGGTESNLAIALARLGRRVAWSSVLPDNPLGHRVVRELNWHGVDTTSVRWSAGSRAGVYFLDIGASPRSTQVLYDRRDSAIAQATPDMIDTTVVEGTRVLHLTGITAALSSGCAEICERLVTVGAGAGAAFSFDVNYRSLLWSPDEARQVLSPLCERADILFCGRDDAETIWGITGSPDEIVAAFADRFQPEIAVVTLGSDGAISLTRDGTIRQTPSVAVEIVEPIGAGDAFAAGFLHGYLNGDLDRAMELGTAVAALKMTIVGDLAVITPDEVDAVVNRQHRGIIR